MRGEIENGKLFGMCSTGNSKNRPHVSGWRKKVNTHTHAFSTKSNDALQQQKSRIRYLSVIIHCSFCAAIFVITCHRVDKTTDRTYKNEKHRTPATTTKLVQSIAYELLSHFGQRNGNFCSFYLHIERNIRSIEPPNSE